MNTQKSPAAVSAEKLANQVSELLQAGGTLGDVFDYTEQDYEVLYALGHSLYSQARYHDAVKAFGFLVMHNHLERRFIGALASSLQMVKSYDEAFSYYSLASVMDLADPVPTFHSAECLIALGRVDDARKCLDMVVRQCLQPDQEALKLRAQSLLQLVDSKSGVKS
ncbi:MAG: SycD/LcrH family type III secretion system chaperone [Ramlibacter sp.]